MISKIRVLPVTGNPVPFRCDIQNILPHIVLLCLKKAPLVFLSVELLVNPADFLAPALPFGMLQIQYCPVIPVQIIG
jgi:hypothetical protein